MMAVAVAVLVGAPLLALVAALVFLVARALRVLETIRITCENLHYLAALRENENATTYPTPMRSMKVLPWRRRGQGPRGV